MKIYTALENIRLMGELNPKYGQSYWGNVEEQKMPVKFNLMSQVDIQPGRKLFAEESEIKTSGAGNEYTQLRKVKLSDSDTPATQETVRQTALSTFDGTAPTTPEMPEETPSYEAGTNARWALKLSTDTYKSVMGRVPEDETDWSVIEDFAKWLLGSFQRLKVYNPDGSLPAIKEDESLAVEPKTGYQKAKATAERLKVEAEEESEE